MAGDGNFKWWMGWGKDPEMFYGPFSSKEEAIDRGKEDGPEDGFTVCEADKYLLRFNIFDADNVLEQVSDHNEEAWGEDGSEIDAPPLKLRDLEDRLTATLSEWWKENQPGRAWAFGDQRNSEYFSPEDT